MKIFIICSVRGAAPEYRKKLEDYVEILEGQGHTVHLPHRDTDQDAGSLGICIQNRKAIIEADRVDIFYSKESQGTHFDLGMAFALDKRIEVVESEPLTKHKSFQNFLKEYEHRNDRRN